MAKSSRYRVPFRRRRKGLTNYYKRRKLLLSGRNRLVVRVTNRYVIAQVMKADPLGDLTLVSAHSGDLRTYGWKGSAKSTPAAYLVGLLAGFKALRAGVREAILDIGLRQAVAGARVFAAAKGAADAGLKIPLGEEVVPGWDRIRGEHIANYAIVLSGEERNKRFRKYIERGLDPSELPMHFEEVKRTIYSRWLTELAEA